RKARGRRALGRDRLVPVAAPEIPGRIAGGRGGGRGPHEARREGKGKGGPAPPLPRGAGRGGGGGGAGRAGHRVAGGGWEDPAAPLATGGTARVLAPLSASIYLDAGGTLVWLGRSDGLRHPRAMLARREPTVEDDAIRFKGDAIRFDVTALHPWRPRSGRRADGTALARGAQTLVASLRRPGCPSPLGLGTLLVGEAPAFPLDRAVRPVPEAAPACDHAAPAAAMVAADPLLGLGPGLTPSGDDFVGGVLFARCVREPARADWSFVAARVVERARTR